MSKPRNIDYVGRNQLCTECGACWGVCPKKNIDLSQDTNGKLHYRVMNYDHCGACTLCIQVCPGIGVDFNELYNVIFDQTPGDHFSMNAIGPRHGIYLGRAMDLHMFNGGASAGVTTAMLAYALEKLKVDGVFVAKMNKAGDGKDPISTAVYLADDRNKLLSGQQSKYITVPMAQCLRHIIYEGRGKRFAFVGVGCQMQALRKAEQMIPALKDRIVLRMGIFCGHCMDRRGARHLLGLLNTSEDTVNQISFREGKWPGHFCVETRDGQFRKIAHLAWTSYVMTLFEKWRCHFCPDPLNQWADISTGDPWLQELARSKGQNIVIPRTAIGRDLLSDAQAQGYVQLCPLDADKVISSQHRTLYRKRLMIRVYNQLARFKKRPFPIYSGMIDQRPLKFDDYKQALKLEILRMIAANRIMAGPMRLLGRLFLFIRIRRLKKNGMWF